MVELGPLGHQHQVTRPRIDQQRLVVPCFVRIGECEGVDDTQAGRLIAAVWIDHGLGNTVDANVGMRVAGLGRIITGVGNVEVLHSRHRAGADRDVFPIAMHHIVQAKDAQVLAAGVHGKHATLTARVVVGPEHAGTLSAGDHSRSLAELVGLDVAAAFSREKLRRDEAIEQVGVCRAGVVRRNSSKTVAAGRTDHKPLGAQGHRGSKSIVRRPVVRRQLGTQIPIGAATIEQIRCAGAVDGVLVVHRADENQGAGTVDSDVDRAAESISCAGVGCR